MQTIAIDIDDVLADNARGFIEFSNKHWGTSLSAEDYQEHWMEMWKVDLDETRRRSDHFHASGAVSSYRHNEEALPVLKKLSESYKLVVVTSRRVSIREHTLEWLKVHYPGVFDDDVVHFAGIWDGKISDSSIHHTKADMCKELGVDFLIDDQLKHCAGVVEAGMRAVLFGDYNWNRADELPDGVTRLRSWKEVGDYFDAERS